MLFDLLRAGAAYWRPHIRELAATRDLVLHELARVSDLCDVPPADGAFYFLVRLRTRQPPMELVERLIREHGVAVIPGTAFGLDGGCHLRVAYGALRRESVAEGMGRLVEGLKKILGGEPER